jgi:hypothetical protein
MLMKAIVLIHPHYHKCHSILDSGASKHVGGGGAHQRSLNHILNIHPHVKKLFKQLMAPHNPLKALTRYNLHYLLDFHRFCMFLLFRSIFCEWVLWLIFGLEDNRYISLIHERQTGRTLGTWTRNNGVWYIDREVPNNGVSTVFIATMERRKLWWCFNIVEWDIYILIKWARYLLM